MHGFHFIHCRHIFHEASSVAHRLAHFASFSYFDDFWLDETPSITENVFYEDLYSCTRGLRSTSPSNNNDGLTI